MSQSVTVEQLQFRVRTLERTVLILIIIFFGLVLAVWLFGSRTNVKATTSESLILKRLAIVDEKGMERIVLAAPLPDPVVEGRRVKRDGSISGVAIYDRDGNERGGYATSDGTSGALLTLDSVNGEVFKVVGNPEHKDGATLFLFNGKHDGIVLTTYSRPLIETIQNRKVIFKNPSDAPDFRD